MRTAGTACTLTAADGEASLPRFTCTAYDGGMMQPRMSWPYVGNVVIDLSGVRVDGGGRDLRVLYHHSTYDPIGHCESVTVANSITAEGVLSVPGESREKIVAAAANGFRWQVSVGMSVDEFERVDEKQTVTVNGRQFRGPCYVARKSNLYEITFLAIGANGKRATAKVTAEPETLEFVDEMNKELRAWLVASGYTNEQIEAITPEQLPGLQAAFDAVKPRLVAAPAQPVPATTPTTVQATQQTSSENPVDLVAQRQEYAAERRRITEIEAIGRRYSGVTIEANGQQVDLIAHAIETGMDVRDVELHALRNSRPAAPAVHATSRDRRATLAAICGGAMLRAGVALDSTFLATDNTREAFLAAGLPTTFCENLNAETRQRAMNDAHEFRSLSLVDLAAEAMRLDGMEVPRNRRALIQASFSSNSLSVIFGLTIGARALQAYSEAVSTVGGWTETATVPDFEDHKRPKLENMESLDHLPPGGEANHAKRSAKAETVAADRYAKQYAIDEQDMMGDNLGLLQRSPREMGLAAARLVPDLVYYVILSNPTLTSTGRALFNTTDGTTAVSGALGTVGNLGVLIAAMQKLQQNGINLNMLPTHLITGAELADTAVRLVGSGVISNDSGLGSTNPIARYGIAPVADARISNGVRHPKTKALATGSATNYYLVDRANTPIEIQFVEGSGMMPLVRVTPLTQGKWGMHVDCKHDVGVGVVQALGMMRGTTS